MNQVGSGGQQGWLLYCVQVHARCVGRAGYNACQGNAGKLSGPGSPCRPRGMASDLHGNVAPITAGWVIALLLWCLPVSATGFHILVNQHVANAEHTGRAERGQPLSNSCSIHL